MWEGKRESQKQAGRQRGTHRDGDKIERGKDKYEN